MQINRLGFSYDQRLFNEDGGGGMGGGGGATNDGGQSLNVSDGGGTPNTTNEPTVYDFSGDDNYLVKVKGSDKPVNFRDHIGGFQKQATQASQRAARFERELQAAQQQLAQFKQQQAQAQQGQRPQQGQPDLAQQIAELPYLSGQDAAIVVQNIQGAIQQRDQILMGALRKMQQMEGVIQGLSGTHSNQMFEAKIAKYLQDGGYDANQWGDFAKELYVAYEGDDLDTEFPNILAQRVEQLRKIFAAEQAAKLNAARQAKQPFVPGRGGFANPSKGLDIKPSAKPSEVADLLFPAILEGSGT